MRPMLHGGEVEFSFSRPDGTRGTVYGNDRALLLIDGAKLSPVVDYERRSGRINGKVVDELFARPSEFVGASTVDRWREFAGEPFEPKEVQQKCSDCRGTGLATCSHCESEIDCEYCDGTGSVTEKAEWPLRPYVRVRGKLHDARLLAPLLELVDGEASVSLAKDILMICGTGWRIAVMSMQPGTGDVEIVDF